MEGIRDERRSRVADDGYRRLRVLQRWRHRAQDGPRSRAGVAVPYGRLAHAVCLSRLDPGAAPPMVEFGQELVSFPLDGLEALVHRPNLSMLRSYEGYALVYDDMFRQTLWFRVGKGGEETREVG